MTKPLVTVAVVCLNEEKHVSDCLRCLLMQSFPAQKFEILVVDNNSTDKTQEIVCQFAKKDPRVRLVINPRRGIAYSRNVALRQARGKFLAFTDADCLPARNWLARLVAGYQNYQKIEPKLVGVGGPNIPPKTTPFYQALGIMLNSFLGSRGSIQSRRYEKDRPVPHLSTVNVLYEKEKLCQTGGFDEKFGSIIEDEDLSYRLWQKGARFYYIARVPVVHRMRPNFRLWAKNMFIYGKGRVWFLKKHPEKNHFYFVFPIILVLFFPLVLSVYLPLIFCYSLWAAVKAKKGGLLFRIFTLFVLTHLAYGVGEIYGIFKKN